MITEMFSSKQLLKNWSLKHQIGKLLKGVFMIIKIYFFQYLTKETYIESISKEKNSVVKISLSFGNIRRICIQELKSHAYFASHSTNLKV